MADQVRYKTAADNPEAALSAPCPGCGGVLTIDGTTEFGPVTLFSIECAGCHRRFTASVEDTGPA